MDAFRPKLLEASTASARMDALCDFIEFWIGPRQPTFGESVSALAKYALPMPLNRLYEFAGRWPNRDHHRPYCVPAFSYQDNLVALEKLKREADDKVVFLYENQAVWSCRTLTEGDDPPVWCYGDQMDEDGQWFNGERLICDSLSRFLATFVLQEITFGSRLYLRDENLASRFEATKNSARPLDIQADGSARIRYSKGQTGEIADAPADAFNFQQLLVTLSAAISTKGNWERNPIVSFHRRRQSSGVRAKHLQNAELVTSLFRLALKKAIEPNEALERKFETDWPL